jgi:hypothetical protein
MIGICFLAAQPQRWGFFDHSIRIFTTVNPRKVDSQSSQTRLLVWLTAVYFYCGNLSIDPLKNR